MEGEWNLDELTRRTRRLEFEDGLNDMQNGLVFLLLGLMCGVFFSSAGMAFYVRALVLYREITIVALVALLPLFVLLTFGVRSLIHHARTRFIWKNRGQIVPLRWPVDRRVTLVAGIVWIILAIAGWAGLSGGAMDLDAGMRVMVAAGGVATGLIYFTMGRSMRIGRYRWVGALGAMLSAALAFLPLSFAWSWPAFGVIWAALLFTSGGIALRHTLRELRGASRG
jgi:uncharacterized membrane protein